MISMPSASYTICNNNEFQTTLRGRHTVAVFLSTNTHASFGYDETVIETIVKLRLADQCYLEIITPLSGLRLPPPGTVIQVRWQWNQTLWQQNAYVERTDLSAQPVLSVVLEGDPHAQENRRIRRHALSLPVTFSTGPLGLKKISSETEDISVQGLRCQLEKPFPEQSPVAMTLTLRGAPLHLQGRVLRCVATRSGMTQVAIRFTQTDNADFKLLKSYLESLP